ncbi:unnamed protein product [Adineta ricciae]|uniref:Protein kinase domain-containing protein n=1 Tax=Adineta ricciae TaxID=249248 RepID=A0A814WLV7_ADIRI|nr:unnamed protein product [Adineta ricciae]CAF1200163.1 unnamed protein product [Adineta ricciae]
MPVTIQDISPSYARYCLLQKPNGTYIIRRLTDNDSIIVSIDYNAKSEEDTSNHFCVALSVRVDETVYDVHIKTYRLPCSEQNTKEDVGKFLKSYSNRLYKSNSNQFPPLITEFVPPPDDGIWYLNSKQLADIDYSRLPKSGQNNAGITKAILHCHRQNDIKVFIKRFDKIQKHFKQELTLLKDLCHPSIIACYGQYFDGSYNHLVFEDAADSLESRCPLKYESMTERMKFVSKVGFQIANAMIYLEKKNIVHRDLTASNVLITSQGYVRVADFGHAIKREEGRNTLERQTEVDEENRFLHRFLAPECLACSKDNTSTNNPASIWAKFTSKSDVWSFGIVIIQMFLDDPGKPYPEIASTRDVAKYVKEERKTHLQPVDCPNDLYLFLQGCWSYETKDRLSFIEVRERMYLLDKISF